MQPERWRELEAVLDEALERDPSERNAWLEHRCSGDPELLAEARSLLAVEKRAEGFLETPAATGVPKEIGPYRIVRKIASGGMGVVYEARHQDSGDRVALKLMRAELSLDDSRLKLFQREIEALARLDHPSIARIFQAGATDDGHHYFAMEFVQGERLDRYVRSHDPSIEERLHIFHSMCDAVHHAHLRGVIHRDLKPSNVLVDDQGRPKVVDFGLARLTGSDVQLTTSFMDVVKIMGTLPYMSPEQARSKPGDIDARSDVYALGVVLYELLTGRLPFDFERVLPHESLRIICEEEPRRPSSSNPALRGALETIVLKALEKEPGRRYASVALLAEDVSRFLHGERIHARPPSTIHLMRKMVLRNKVPSVAIAGIVLSLVVFSATLLAKNSELRAQTRRAGTAEMEASAQAELARAEAVRATEVVRFLQNALETLSPDTSKGDEVTMREVLDRTALALEEEFADQPIVRSTLHETIGRAYYTLGHAARAEEHLRAHLELGTGDAEGSTRRRAEAHDLLASALEDQGKYEAAVEELETSLSLYRALPDADESLAAALLHLGRIRSNLGQGERAAEDLEEAREVTAAGPEEDEPRAPEPTLLEAELLWGKGDEEGAEELFREALGDLLERYGEEHTATAEALASLAMLLIESGRPEEAEELFQRSLETRRLLLGEDHYVTVATRSNLATLYVQLGRFEEAEPVLREVVEGWPEGDDHEDRAATLSTLGAVCSYLERDEEAIVYMRRALDAYLASEANQPEMLSNHLANLARVESNLGHLEEAEANASESLELRREALGEGHPKVSDCLHLLAEIRYARGDLESAVERLAESVELLIALRGEGHPEVTEGQQLLDEWFAELDAVPAGDEVEARETPASQD